MSFRSQEDLANLIREKERTPGIRIVEGENHLPVEVEEEMMGTAVAVMKILSLASHSI